MVLNMDCQEVNIYDDLVEGDLGSVIVNLQARNKQLEDHITSLENDVQKLCGTLTNMKRTQDNLTRNISELYKTAKIEIGRKDKMIADLRSQLDDILFRRGGTNQMPDMRTNKRFRDETHVGETSELKKQRYVPNEKNTPEWSDVKKEDYKRVSEKGFSHNREQFRDSRERHYSHGYNRDRQSERDKFRGHSRHEAAKRDYETNRHDRYYDKNARNDNGRSGSRDHLKADERETRSPRTSCQQIQKEDQKDINKEIAENDVTEQLAFSDEEDGEIVDKTPPKKIKVKLPCRRKSLYDPPSNPSGTSQTEFNVNKFIEDQKKVAAKNTKERFDSKSKRDKTSKSDKKKSSKNKETNKDQLTKDNKNITENEDRKAENTQENISADPCPNQKLTSDSTTHLTSEKVPSEQNKVDNQIEKTSNKNIDLKDNSSKDKLVEKEKEVLIEKEKKVLVEKEKEVLVEKEKDVMVEKKKENQEKLSKKNNPKVRTSCKPIRRTRSTAKSPEINEEKNPTGINILAQVVLRTPEEKKKSKSLSSKKKLSNEKKTTALSSKDISAKVNVEEINTLCDSNNQHISNKDKEIMDQIRKEEVEKKIASLFDTPQKQNIRDEINSSAMTNSSLETSTLSFETETDQTDKLNEVKDFQIFKSNLPRSKKGMYMKKVLKCKKTTSFQIPHDSVNPFDITSKSHQENKTMNVDEPGKKAVEDEIIGFGNTEDCNTISLELLNTKLGAFNKEDYPNMVVGNENCATPLIKNETSTQPISEHKTPVKRVLVSETTLQVSYNSCLNSMPSLMTPLKATPIKEPNNSEMLLSDLNISEEKIEQNESKENTSVGNISGNTIAPNTSSGRKRRRCVVSLV